MNFSAKVQAAAFFATEYIAGKTLREAMKRASLSSSDALDIALANRFSAANRLHRLNRSPGHQAGKHFAVWGGRIGEKFSNSALPDHRRKSRKYFTGKRRRQSNPKA